VSDILPQGKNSLGLMWWFLCREVLRLRGSISRELPWDIMPDLFFYRDPEEVEKEEQAKREAEEAQTLAQQTDQWSSVVPATEVTTDAAAGQWDAAGDWGAAPMAASQVTPTVAPVVGGPTPAAPAGFTAPGGTDQDWNMAAGTTTDWGAEDGGDWGSTEPKATAGNW
jgi:small subunit ribosomal protein SAe